MVADAKGVQRPAPAPSKRGREHDRHDRHEPQQVPAVLPTGELAHGAGGGEGAEEQAHAGHAAHLGQERGALLERGVHALQGDRVAQ